MSTAMYDAREAMIPGSVYDRSSHLNGGNPLFKVTAVIIIVMYLEFQMYMEINELNAFFG